MRHVRKRAEWQSLSSPKELAVALDEFKSPTQIRQRLLRHRNRALGCLSANIVSVFKLDVEHHKRRYGALTDVFKNDR